MFSIRKCFINSNEIHSVIGNEELYFGWQMESDKNNVTQVSYEIELLNYNKEVIWTIKKDEENSNNILYDGDKLKSGQEYLWKVKVWNNYNEFSESKLNSFEMGLLNKEDWIGKWIEADLEVKSIKEDFNIGNIFSYHPNAKEIEEINLDPPIVFSKEIKVENKKIKRARIYATAHGVYEINLNGEKVGDDYLAPGFTSYNKLQYYQTYDITNKIKENENKFEITVADGWYKSKLGLAGIGHQFGDKVALLTQIEIEYSDGEKVIIGSDNSFKAYVGEVEYSDLFIGEKQNHILKEKNFLNVIEKDYGYKNLKADIAEPIRCIEKIKAVSIIKTPNGENIIDFGRNIAGIVEVKVKGNKGDIVQLQHSEELDKDRNFFFNLLGQNKYQTNTFVLSGEGEEVFIPKFTYQGFRYVKIISYPGKIDKENFTAYVLSSACKRSGQIETSNEKINKLLENIYNSQESNFISVPTDCPQREKGGWTGDAQIYIPTAIFNMKIDNFMKRWLENMRLDQFENGQIPGLTPWIESDNLLSSGFGNVSAAGWSDACIIIPWNLYNQYEDINFLKDNYEMMKKWLEYVENRCASNVTEESESYERYIWDMDFHYGDWMIPSCVNEDGKLEPMISAKLTANQVATMYFAYSSVLLSNIAKILDKEEDKNYYYELSKKVKDAFKRKFVDANGNILNDLQGLYVLATYFEMGNDEENRKFVNRLKTKIQENGNRLDTGFLSTPILLDTLNNYGEKDLVYKLLLQEECPSWLYMVNQGATTIWECWDAIRPDGNRNLISYNHYSLGSVQDYIVRRICGLEKVLDEKGKYEFKPDLESPFEYCNLFYESIYGKIELIWDLRDSKKYFKIVVPIGATVVLKLPGKEEKKFKSGIYEINIK